MKTYTTEEGLVYCGQCGTYLGEEYKITVDECSVCEQIESWPENEDDIEKPFNGETA